MNKEEQQILADAQLLVMLGGTMLDVDTVKFYRAPNGQLACTGMCKVQNIFNNKLSNSTLE